ncbi:hypothetical protein PLESTF_001446400 [Pleodorina starrii]|nr:hypothetical protein PLESTF_001446400 [Pleodorina starrii]
MSTMDPSTRERHSVHKGDKGIKALDILRFQFPTTKEDCLSEYLRTYKARGLVLPVASLPGTGKASTREYTQPVVTSKAELGSLLGCFKDRGQRFLEQYQGDVDKWFPTSTSGRQAGDPRATAANGDRPLPTCCSKLRDLVILPHDHSIRGTLPDWGAVEVFLADLELETGTKYRRARQQEDKPGVLTREYRCMFGGKPSWQVRAKRADVDRGNFTRAHAGVSKKCGCPALLVLRLCTPYAKQQGLYRAGDSTSADDGSAGAANATPNPAQVNATTQPGGAGPSAVVNPRGGAYGDASSSMATDPAAGPATAMDTTVRLHLHLQHSGHTPHTAADLVAQFPGCNVLIICRLH